MKNHQKIYIIIEESEQNTYAELKKAHSLLKDFFLIFKFYNNQLTNNLIFYMGVAHTFDNNLLKLF